MMDPIMQSLFDRKSVRVFTGEPVTAEEVQDYKNTKELKHILKERAVKLYEAKEAEFPEAEAVRELERVVLLNAIDRKWMAHIDSNIISFGK